MRYRCWYLARHMGEGSEVEAPDATRAAILFAERTSFNVVKPGDEVTVFVGHGDKDVQLYKLTCVRTFKPC